MSEPAFDIDSLSPAERWDLIERLWTSIGDDAHELTDLQRREFDRRIASLDDDIANGRPLGRPWSEVRDRLFRRPSQIK